MGYFGSKTASGAWQAIVAQKPPHDTYIEAFQARRRHAHQAGAACSLGVDLDPRPTDAAPG